MTKSSINLGSTTYRILLDRYLAKGKTTAQAHKIASSPIMRKPDRVDKPSWGDKLILSLLRRGKKKKTDGVK